MGPEIDGGGTAPNPAEDAGSPPAAEASERASIASSILPTHLRATRRSWLFLLVAAYAVWGVVEGALTLARMSDAVVPGVYYSHRMRVSLPVPRAAASAGVQIDDYIVALDGRALAGVDDLDARLATFAPGTTVRITVAHGARDNPPHDITLVAFQPNLATAGLRYACGAVFALLGVLVFWFHPGRRESWPFLFGCVAYGATILFLFGAPRTTQSLVDSRAGLAANPLIGVSFLWLFAVFPRPLRLVVRRPWLAPGLALVGLALGVTLAFAASSDAATIALARASAMLNLVAAATCIAILVWRSRRTAPRDDVTRLRAVVVAVLIAFPLPGVYALNAAFRLWIPDSDLPIVIVSLATAAFPLLVGYAMVRRDLFEVDHNIARAASASAAVGGLGLVVVVIAIAMPRLVAPASVLASPTATALAVLAAVAVLWPVKQRLQRRLLASFDATSLNDRLVEVREALAALAEEPSPPRFGRFERRLEQAFDLPDAALLVRDDTGWHRPATAERVDPKIWPRVVELARDDKVLGAFGLGRAGHHVALGPADLRALERLGLDVTRALRAEHKGDRIGDYRIERFIAAGGMGNVYLGAKVGAAGFVKPVAIKQLLPEVAVDPEAVALFLKEARVVARLSHPGIVQTLELGETDRGYFIVMEYIEGVDAATLMRRIKRRRHALPLTVACHVVTSACLALEHAHHAVDDGGQPMRLVHHDVSPHNLMIDGDGNVKLADFGVAHVRHDPSREGRLVGKIGYMAPEQLRREPTDHRVDVFAAGIVLYELVTGQHPFAGGSDFLTLRAIESGRYLPAEMIRQDCPPQLALVIDRALASQPGARFATAAELAEAIQRCYPLDSRHAAELGRLVRSVQAGDSKLSGGMVGPTLTLPTARG